MSAALAANTDRSKDHTVATLLDDLDLLGHGLRLDGSLSERDQQRARIAKFVASKPEGVVLPHIVAYPVKGITPTACPALDGADPDYTFTRSFVHDLAKTDPPLVETHTNGGITHVTPTLTLVDLIVEGITQTIAETDDLLYDSVFLENYLRSVSAVGPKGRYWLADALDSYLTRIEDYRLLFDVHSCSRSGRSTERMTKGYKTRFNSEGRIRKQFARFNSALEYGYAEADNAVLCTLTTDPKQHDSLYEAIASINTNFNRLLSYFDTDPVTLDDTRTTDVSYPEGTSRPRYRPAYLKALEFTERGYPHLHVLFFDVPERPDGCPWLIDKQELSDKWRDYGQGSIVDLYPLTYRDDLATDDLGDLIPDLDLDLDDGPAEAVTWATTETVIDTYAAEHSAGARFPQNEGFVCWYRHGSNDLTEDEIRDRSRAHTLGMADESVYQKTAGAYLGKYLSLTFGGLLDAVGEAPDDRYHEKMARWKLGLYWATNRRFWSISKDIERAIEKRDTPESAHVRDGIRWATIETIESEAPDDLDREHLAAAIEFTLPSSSAYWYDVDYLGCYAYWDLPISAAAGPDLETIEESDDPDTPALPTLMDRPPNELADLYA